jgi:hypothetical protein
MVIEWKRINGYIKLEELQPSLGHLGIILAIFFTLLLFHQNRVRIDS